jgi:hypothetical protein
MKHAVLLSFVVLQVVQVTLAQETIPNYTPPAQGNDYPGNDISVSGQTGYFSGMIGFFQPGATACANVCDTLTSGKCVCFIYYSEGLLANKCFPKSSCPTSSNKDIIPGSKIWFYRSTAPGRSSASIASPTLVFSTFASIAVAVFIAALHT